MFKSLTKEIRILENKLIKMRRDLHKYPETCNSYEFFKIKTYEY